MASIHFLGAAGTVTGSKFLLEHEGKRVLIDAGLFQGEKALRERNWNDLPVPAKSIDAIVLTHAHIDHTGGLPRVVTQGFDGAVYCTPGTAELARLLLPDSAKIQEEEAEYANRHHYSKHSPARPLYGVKDAERALRLFETFGYGRTREILPGIHLTFARAGHILGSAICQFELASTRQRVVFSGDLGRYDVPILRDPEDVAFGTTVIAECTYGNRAHSVTKPSDTLAEIVNEAAGRGGWLIIPAFAVGRTQDILYCLRRLEDERVIPALDVYVDSPMACDVTPIYLAHPEDHDEAMRALLTSGRGPFSSTRTHFVNSVAQSKDLNMRKGPGIVISASGMATGGRILHHLKNRLPDPKNTVLFVGYQAHGTRGRRMVNGEAEIKLHGQLVPVRAQIRQISGFSAHADKDEMLRWLSGFSSPPRQTLLVHGEPNALSAMRATLQQRGWDAHVPVYMERVELKP